MAHLLKNRFYISEVVYRGEVHRGEHEPILARDVFEAVQAKLAGNAIARQLRLKGSAAILTGRIFDDRGNRMSPTHSNKRGVRYRYYVSHALLPTVPRFRRAFRSVDVAVNHLKVWQTPKIEQTQPGHVQGSLPDAEEAGRNGQLRHSATRRLHPRFARRGTSLKTRNGVGVRADGKVIFVISQEAVSFDAFARLFRDGLKCPNALFLDGGSASSLYAPTLNHPGNIVPLGPMLAVFETNRAAPGQ